MTDSDLDGVYTQLCKTMTNIGEADAALFLARFALLAITAVDDPVAARKLIAEAADGMPQAAPGMAVSARFGAARPQRGVPAR